MGQPLSGRQAIMQRAIWQWVSASLIMQLSLLEQPRRQAPEKLSSLTGTSTTAMARSTSLRMIPPSCTCPSTAGKGAPPLSLLNNFEHAQHVTPIKGHKLKICNEFQPFTNALLQGISRVVASDGRFNMTSSLYRCNNLSYTMQRSLLPRHRRA